MVRLCVYVCAAIYVLLDYTVVVPRIAGWNCQLSRRLPGKLDSSAEACMSRQVCARHEILTPLSVEGKSSY